MDNNKGFTIVELLITLVIVAITGIVAMSEFDRKHKGSNSTNYSDYTSKCMQGHKYMVSKNGNIRQLLNTNQEPVLCEDENKNTEKGVSIEVNANPYKNLE